MKRGKSTSKPTQVEQDRMDTLKDRPCIACVVGKNPLVCGPTEIHHLVHNGYRRLSGGHMATIPLGSWHHSGQPFSGFSNADMRHIFGPSMKHEKKRFVSTYGTELSLLARIDDSIAERREIAGRSTRE